MPATRRASTASKLKTDAHTVRTARPRSSARVTLGTVLYRPAPLKPARSSALEELRTNTLRALQLRSTIARAGPEPGPSGTRLVDEVAAQGLQFASHGAAAVEAGRRVGGSDALGDGRLRDEAAVGRAWDAEAIGHWAPCHRDGRRAAARSIWPRRAACAPQASMRPRCSGRRAAAARRCEVAASTRAVRRRARAGWRRGTAPRPSSRYGVTAAHPLAIERARRVLASFRYALGTPPALGQQVDVRQHGRRPVDDDAGHRRQQRHLAQHDDVAGQDVLELVGLDVVDDAQAACATPPRSCAVTEFMP